MNRQLNEALARVRSGRPPRGSRALEGLGSALPSREHRPMRVHLEPRMREAASGLHEFTLPDLACAMFLVMTPDSSLFFLRSLALFHGPEDLRKIRLAAILVPCRCLFLRNAARQLRRVYRM